MNRPKDIVIIVFVSIVVLAGFWGIWRTGVFNKLLVLPEPDIQSTNITFEINKPFKLQRNQTAIIKGGSSTVRISSFINEPCPSGVQCVWSGQRVNYEIIVDGKIYGSNFNNLNEAPFIVQTRESDYKTYAVLVVSRR